MQQTLKQQERSLRWFTKNRGWFTCVLLLNIAIQASRVFAKRSQWPFLFSYPHSVGIPLDNSIWINILAIALLSFGLVSWWVRVHNYRRDLLLAEQMALQKAARPPEGVRPPPPL